MASYFFGGWGEQSVESTPRLKLAVPLLLERLENSNHKADRRSATEDLKELAPEKPNEVGQGIPTLLHALVAHPRDNDVTQNVLEIILSIVSISEVEQTGEHKGALSPVCFHFFFFLLFQYRSGPAFIRRSRNCT